MHRQKLQQQADRKRSAPGRSLSQELGQVWGNVSVSTASCISPADIARISQKSKSTPARINLLHSKDSEPGEG